MTFGIGMLVPMAEGGEPGAVPVSDQGAGRVAKEQLLLEDGIPVGNIYDKYHTGNPFARLLMRGFLNAFSELVEVSGAMEVHEVGCGEGELSIYLARLGKAVRASDFSIKIIDRARTLSGQATIAPPGSVEFRAADLYRLNQETDSAPLIVCCEVLEHLEQPRAALERLAALARPYLIVSVPREPIWRILNLARGKYLSRLGNTPGHVQAWTRRSFMRLLDQHFDIVAARSPLPWTMALCRSRGKVAPSP